MELVRYFTNKETKEKVRFDFPRFKIDRELLPGRAGIGHWHRLNTENDDINRYLDADGKPCSILSNRSMLPPEKQDSSKDFPKAIVGNPHIFSEKLQSIINILDNRFENWMHDSIITDLELDEFSILHIVHNRRDETIKSLFSFTGCYIEEDFNLDKSKYREVYGVKIEFIFNEKNVFSILTSLNEEYHLIFEDYFYNEEIMSD